MEFLRKPHNLFVVSLIVCTLFPWAQLSEFSESGFQLQKFLFSGNYVWAMTIIAAIYFLAAFNDSSFKVIPIITGIAPIIRFVYSIAKVDRRIFHVLAIQAYLTPLSTAVVLALTFTAPSAMAADTRPEFVIAVLGDSYASGEGAPDEHGKHSPGGDLIAGECAPMPGDPPELRRCFSETWWSPDKAFPGRLAVFPQGDDPGWQADSKRCHRSSKGPGAQAAIMIAARFPDIKITVLNFACGGSKITEGLLVGWPGPEPALGASNLPSQIQALEEYVKGRPNKKVDAIVMNVGGNDALFGEIVKFCLVLPLANCANDQNLLQKLGAIVANSDEPAFPDVSATLRARYRVVDAAFRNRPRPAGATGALDKGRPDEVYLTGPPNPSHGAASNATPSASNPDNFCDGTQSNDFDFYNVNLLNPILSTYTPGYRNVEFAESVVMENLVGKPVAPNGNLVTAGNSMNIAMQRAAERHGWVFIDMFGITRTHGVCANASSFFRTNKDALRIQGDEGLMPPLTGLGPLFISAGIAHQNEDGYAARAVEIAKIVGEQVQMRFRPATLALASVKPGPGPASAGEVTFSWNDPSPHHLPETRWELEFVKRGVSTPLRAFSDSPTSRGNLTETLFASGRNIQWRVSAIGEFDARVRGCRQTKTKLYCGPYSNAVTVVTFLPGTPVNPRHFPLPRTVFETALGVAPIGSNDIQVKWTPGPNTPISVRYEVAHGEYGPNPCQIGGIPAICGFGMVNTTNSSTTSTTFREASHTPAVDMFTVRACSTAGCSNYTPAISIKHVNVRVREQPGLVLPKPGPDLPDLPDLPGPKPGPTPPSPPQ